VGDRLQILVLDDSELALEVIAAALREAGFGVRAVASLPAFELAMEAALPDVIVTDLQMPEVTGDNVCRLLKRLHDTEAIPIIICSSLDEEAIAPLAARAGADGYVSKQGGPEALVARLTALTEEVVF
jgi:CheY-like chemotaxis protein